MSREVGAALATARRVERGVGEGVCWEAAFGEGDAIKDRAGTDTERWSDAAGRQSGIAHGGSPRALLEFLDLL